MLSLTSLYQKNTSLQISISPIQQLLVFNALIFQGLAVWLKNSYETTN
jgi:hypothetical protein